MDKRKRKKKKLDADEAFENIDGVLVHKVPFEDLNLFPNPDFPPRFESDKYKDIIVFGDSRRNCTIKSPCGYGSIRASHGAIKGTYYFEVKIDTPTSEQSHTRIGWSNKHAELCVPFGYDQHSYSYRDKGDVFHKSQRKDYGKSYGKGDVIGCLIHLKGYNVDEYPTKIEEFIQDGKKFKFIETNYPTIISQGSFIKFYLNGKDQGIAFHDLEAGKYFPAISLYGGANVSIIFEKNSLNYPPKDLEFSTF